MKKICLRFNDVFLIDHSFCRALSQHFFSREKDKKKKRFPLDLNLAENFKYGINKMNLLYRKQNIDAV